MVFRFAIIILALAAGIGIIIYAVNKAFNENEEIEKRNKEKYDKKAEEEEKRNKEEKECEKHNARIFANYDVVNYGMGIDIEDFKKFLKKADIKYEDGFVYDNNVHPLSYRIVYHQVECLLLPRGTSEVVIMAYNKYLQASIDKAKKEVEDKANEILKKVGIENV